MANNKSAEKRIRQTERRTVINGNRVSRIRTFIKKVEVALAAGNSEAAHVALKAAEPEIRRGVSKGVLHLKTASRKISRLTASVRKLTPAAS